MAEPEQLPVLPTEEPLPEEPAAGSIPVSRWPMQISGAGADDLWGLAIVHWDGKTLPPEVHVQTGTVVP